MSGKSEANFVDNTIFSSYMGPKYKYIDNRNYRS